jgi:hypothetical protein
LEKQKMKEQLTARLVDGRAIEEGSTRACCRRARKRGGGEGWARSRREGERLRERRRQHGREADRVSLNHVFFFP